MSHPEGIRLSDSSGPSSTPIRATVSCLDRVAGWEVPGLDEPVQHGPPDGSAKELPILGMGFIVQTRDHEGRIGLLSSCPFEDAAVRPKFTGTP